MSEYYLSASGSDSNSGSFTSPWRSITKLNTAFSSGQIGLGDKVLLERGTTFYGKLRQPDSLDPALPGWLQIGSYGAASQLPVISGYKLLSAWTQYDATIWSTNLSVSGGYDGAQGSGDVGFVKVDGVIHGYRRTSLLNLTQQWDFYTSGTTLYVRSTANPTSLASDIRCSVDGDGSNLRSGVELRQVAIVGHGGNGVAGPGIGGTTRCRVIDCEIYEIGGSALDGYGDGNVRYGNGIQGWIGTKGLHVEGNKIHDVYDVAYSIQGGSAGQTQTFENIMVRRNLFYRNSQSMEYWYGGEGPGFVNCVAEYNTCLFAGYGWGAEVRPETQSRVHILTFGWGTNANLINRRNIFYDARTAYRYSDENPVGMVNSGNIILLRPGTLMRYQTSETIETAPAWAAADGRDTDSLFMALPASSDTVISDADVALALAYLDAVPTGQRAGNKVLPIHARWQA